MKLLEVYLMYHEEPCCLHCPDPVKEEAVPVPGQMQRPMESAVRLTVDQPLSHSQYSHVLLASFLLYLVVGLALHRQISWQPSDADLMYHLPQPHLQQRQQQLSSLHLTSFPLEPCVVHQLPGPSASLHSLPSSSLLELDAVS